MAWSDAARAAAAEARRAHKTARGNTFGYSVDYTVGMSRYSSDPVIRKQIAVRLRKLRMAGVKSMSDHLAFNSAVESTRVRNILRMIAKRRS